MDKRTLKALHGSIRKWIKIATWKGGDEGSDNCPLCGEFLDNDCGECPIAMKTCEEYCFNTPYRNWCKEFEALPCDTKYIYPEDTVVFSAKTQKAAEEMTLFLIDLLPEEEKARYYEAE